LACFLEGQLRNLFFLCNFQIPALASYDPFHLIRAA
jgi:hypothetical protein